MVFIPDSELERFIAEDVPSIDLTTCVLGIGDVPGEIEYFTRESCILCGTEEVARMCTMLGLEVVSSLPSGTVLEAGQSFLVARGPAERLHAAWKVCLNVFDHCSAYATKTRKMVDAAHAANPSASILTTRKSMPGTKLLVLKSIMCGGACPHRLGLSETVLVFDHHITFMGGYDAFLEKLPQIRASICEKKLFVEADGEHARILAKAGVDGIQFDKVKPAELAGLVEELRGIDPHLTLIAAGGINLENVAEYAACGVDGIATTCLFTAKPLDMSVRMRKIEG